MEEQTEQTPEQIALAQFEANLQLRASELSKANGNKKVFPIWYLDPVDPVNGKPIIGYLLEPNRATKGSIMDTLIVSRSRAATVALNACLMVKEKESDSRILSTDSVYDSVFIAAGLKALDLITIAIDQFKKK